MVGSGTRNARAISGVVRPPTRRSVSATRPSAESTGWQHVKIKRRRSSGIVAGAPPPAPPPAAAPRACTGSTRPHRTSHLPDGPHLDVTVLAERQLLGPLDRLVLAVALDQVVAAQRFLRLGERPIDDLRLAGLEPHSHAVTVGT